MDLGVDDLHRPPTISNQPIAARSRCRIGRAMALQGLNLTRTEFADGRSYGKTGPYEQLRGSAEFALHVANPATAAGPDRALAPRDGQGRVWCSTDVRLLRPVDPAKSNRRLLLDVVNRGGPTVIRSFDTGKAARGNAESDA